MILFGELPQDILDNIQIDFKNGCWLWKKINSDGYGRVFKKYHEIAYSPHRLMYILLKGQIPEDKEIDHLCRVRNCCNPAHLEAVTKDINMFRTRGFPRKNVCIRGHEYTPENTYRSPSGVRACRACRGINTAHSTANNIERYRESQRKSKARNYRINREFLIAKQKEYAKRNKEKIREKMRAYYLANKEKWVRYKQKAHS